MLYIHVVVAFSAVAIIGCDNSEKASRNTDPRPPRIPAVAEANRETSDIWTMGDTKPWRSDPALAGSFHPSYPDDLQVIVHDGGPHFADKPPELIWVTVTGKAERAYHGKILNQPHGLESVEQGDEIVFLVVDGAEHPFKVSEKYLSERDEWVIKGCDQCGFSELFDAPSDLLNKVFPNVGTNANEELEVFTSFCPICGGVQVIHKPGIEGTTTDPE